MVRRVNNLVHTLLRGRRWIVALVQAGLVFCSLVAAWLLRFDFHLTHHRLLLAAAPILIVIRLALMPLFNLMHGWWRYTGISDAFDVLKAVVCGSAAFFVAIRLVGGVTGFPLSIYALEGLLTFILLVGVRLLSRIILENLQEPAATSRRVLLIGAGHAAQMLIRETQQVPTGYSVVGCVDDNPLKLRLKILGIPVLGPVERLSEVAKQAEADEVLIAIPSATNAQMRRFVEICKEAHLPFRTIPGLTELILGRSTFMEQVREVRLEDLLGRAPVNLELATVRTRIKDRAVMVTGAAGSIGSELCRQILRYDPAFLLCVDQNETGLFYLQQELSKHGKNQRAVFCVADVGDEDRMRKLFLGYDVDIVFHAAAYKHVPMMEANIEEAVSNNVFKLLTLLEVAQSSGCGSFVMISSDKAVNPTSVMGCTKRIGKLILAAWPRQRLHCVSVRFGNVLGSSGSVVPLFQEQIRLNQPITITHPEINRFFMTIPEAVSLVLQASVVGKHGDILVLDMGEPIRIVDLAHTLIQLSGKSKTEVEIKFTGLRPGEKLFEDLFYASEKALPTACDKVRSTQSALQSWPELEIRLHALHTALFEDGKDPIREQLHAIVPEYTGADSEALVPAGKIPPSRIEETTHAPAEKRGRLLNLPPLHHPEPQPAQMTGTDERND